MTGLEIQVLDDYGPKWKDLKPDQFTAAIYAVQPPSERHKKGRRMADPAHPLRRLQVPVWVNGRQVIKADLAKLAEKVKNVPGLKRTGGFIGLQTIPPRCFIATSASRN